MNRWKKYPKGLDWKEITKRLTEEKRKKEFIGRLAKGRRYNLTDNPGPY